jgi:predicted DNA-binding transcriptional regulator YafY
MADQGAATGNSALQRLVTITSVLGAAGPAGRAADELAGIAGYGGTPESRRESLARDIRNLNTVGLDIRNVAAPGAGGHYVLRPSDSRVTLAFTPEQRAELARAALLAGRAGLAAGLTGTRPAPAPDLIRIDAVGLPGDMDAVLRAVGAGCVLRFTYNGKPRELDPHAVHRAGGEWSVTGFERQSGRPRVFAIARMADVTVGAPGTAGPPSDAPRPSTDPLSWLMDPALDAVISYDSRYAGDVARLLPVPAPAGDDAAGGRQEATVIVTNRWIFLARIAELGERVRLEGPDELRQEFAERLRAVAEGAA